MPRRQPITSTKVILLGTDNEQRQRFCERDFSRSSEGACWLLALVCVCVCVAVVCVRALQASVSERQTASVSERQSARDRERAYR